MADSATFSTLLPRCGKEAFLGSRFGMSTNSNYGKYVVATTAVPAAGSDPVYSSPFHLNVDSPTVQVRVYNTASTSSKINITMQYTYDFSTWTDVSTSVFLISLGISTTNDTTASFLTSLLPGIAYRIKHDPDGGTPAGGGTVYIEVFQFQN